MMNPTRIRKGDAAGFSLVEILVALSIFALVATTTTAALLAVIDANAKSRTLRSAIDNMNVALDSMSRVIRFGTKYCDVAGFPDGCSATRFNFMDQDGHRISYYLSGTTIYKQTIVDGVLSAELPLTAPEISIDALTFTLTALGTQSDHQPRLTIFIKGRATQQAGKVSTEFSVQTTVSRRQFE